MLQPLPPHVQRVVDELLACAPPLTDEAEQAIRTLALYRRPLAGTLPLRETQAA